MFINIFITKYLIGGVLIVYDISPSTIPVHNHVFTVFLHCRDLKKASSVSSQARDIFRRNYGAQHDVVKEVDTLIDNIKSVYLR